MIYDYIECQRLLDNFNNSIIKEVEPIGYTSLEKLPIRHFTLGSGDKHIVVSASQHSNELITTTFVLHLMNFLVDNDISFDDLTIHFIPILNPEGYIVNSSAVRYFLPRDASDNMIINFCHDFYNKYKIDCLYHNFVKLHQQIFSDVDYRAINNNYLALKDSVLDILSSHPKGAIIDWASNGKGVDLNSNSSRRIVKSGEFNRQKQYNNIRLDIPSPIGYPGLNTDINFIEENEVLALKNLLSTLNDSGKLLLYLNYHSTGGIIYQRPEDTSKIFSTFYNYLVSKFYQEYTIRNNSNYEIIKSLAGKITSVNDDLRINYPGNLLIELSAMTGNSIGVFGDINNFHNTINGNIKSFIYVMKNIGNIYDFSLMNFNDINVNNMYNIIDKCYDGIRKKLIKH